MSSGVSDQMKVPGNTAKSIEERNIPWSQQVDEASYENLASPTVDDNAAIHQSAMQFQYPPFNVKDSQNASWNNKSRKTAHSFESKKYAKSAFYNSTKREDSQPNAWGIHNASRIGSENMSGNYNRSHRSEDEYASEKLDNRPSVNVPADVKKICAPAPVAAPKKTTWASIASQPAKLASRTTSIASSHKKKGPGMPPPPMVPGKHNLDVNAWDLPNNNPPPVPSPPPQIEPTYCEASRDLTSSIKTDFDLGIRSERGPKSIGNDSAKEDGKSNVKYSNNFGRVRSSPNGHPRKNWSAQHPINHNRPIVSGISTGSMRRNDNNIGNNGRYGDRRPSNYGGTGSESENVSYDFRDENCPRIASGQIANIEEVTTESPQAVLDELRDKNNYNPAELNLEKATSARFFVIKSYSEDDIHRSIKYEIWCSTDHGNKRLDDAFKERQKEGGNILLFFSVNGSGHFCGMAQMMTAVDYNSTSSVWSQDKWKGKFKVKWIYVKDVPNNKLRHIRLENNENKSVTNSRDTQEVPNNKGIEVLQILHSYKHSTSIFDDFYHYEKKQEEEVSLKKPITSHDSLAALQSQSPVSRHYGRQTEEQRDREHDSRSIGVSHKYFGGGSTSNFRERNNLHRSGYHNSYQDNRRFDGQRSGASTDYQPRDKDGELDRENTDYGGGRHGHKFDYSRGQMKHNNRERDFNEDFNKSESRFRTGSKELQKDNEYTVADRIRGTEY